MPSPQTNHHTHVDDHDRNHRIDIDDASSDSVHLLRPNPMTATVLVLAMAAAFMIVVTLALAQWAGTSRESHLVDTSDCRVIAASASAELLEATRCTAPIAPGVATPADPASEGHPMATSLQLPVPVPGIWLQEALRSLD